MTPEEIERRAMHNELFPVGLNQAEQLLFMSFRCLYQSYRTGTLSKEQAQNEKRELLRTFEDNSRWIKIYKQSDRIRLKLAGMSKEVESGSCDRCKQIMRIIDGRTP